MRLQNYPNTALEGSDNIVGWFKFHAHLMLAYESGKKRQPGVLYEHQEEAPYIFRLSTFLEVHDELFKRRRKAVNDFGLTSRRIRNLAPYARALLHQRQQRKTEEKIRKRSRSAKLALVYVNPNFVDKKTCQDQNKSHSHLVPI